MLIELYNLLNHYYYYCNYIITIVCSSSRSIFLAVKHFTANVVAKNYEQCVIERGCH